MVTCFIGLERTVCLCDKFILSFRKPFKKLGFEVSEDVVKSIVSCKPWAIEHFMMMLRRKIDRHLYEHRRDPQGAPSYTQSERPSYDTRPEVDQVITGD